MQHLILVKHALPEISAEVPPHQWRLALEGRRRCQRLAQRVARYQPLVMVASREPKAVETAALLAASLETSFEIGDDLYEQDRSTSPLLSAEQFEHAIVQLFQHPRELVFGRETAEQARERFTRALHHILEHAPHGNVLVVTHGTVMALFVAQATQSAPYEWWRRLGLPAVVVLSLPEWAVVEVVEQVAEP